MREELNNLKSEEAENQNLEEHIRKDFEAARLMFKSLFGIENFSAIEQWHLRKTCEEVEKEVAGLKRKAWAVQEYTLPASFYGEIERRWFWRMYGLNLDDPEVKKRRDTEKFKQEIKFLREQAHNPGLE